MNSVLYFRILPRPGGVYEQIAIRWQQRHIAFLLELIDKRKVHTSRVYS